MCSFFSHFDAMCTNEVFFFCNSRLPIVAFRFVNLVLDTSFFETHFMSQWCWNENRMTEAWLEPWHWKEKLRRAMRRRTVPKIDPQRTLSKNKRKNHGTHSDETEDEEVKPSRPLPDCQILFLKNGASARVPDWCDRESGGPPGPEVQTNDGNKAFRGDHKRASQRRAE